ncbi:predicted protein [Naegleria gruberi]|uniref:Predicted protein n=1 Tax=Naegleria gruberi TaxID=5762 RepID=D2VKT4_NAEGR|nr:uncharacterized protein NAEGRDRAFT_69505 [Naegleria gruberi]EFC42744.1 predicted protein [Naegleria gruberi]|eukprot:XP_002675488.1 predicted protein [Naegleria gruberi strain NEG-M]
MFEFTKISGLEDVKEVDLSTLAVALNCYVTNENNGNIRLAFPRRTIRKYLGIYGPSFSIQRFVKTIPQFLDKGATFEILIGSFIVWKSKLGLLQNSNFGSVFPFLTGTTLADKLCINFPTMITNKRTRENAESEWKKVHLHFSAYQNRLSIMKEKSRGPDMFIVFEQDLWWCIQDKNKSEFSFTELYGEIDKLKDFPPNVKIIFTMFYRCKLEKELLGVFYEGSIIDRPKVGSQQIQVPKNVTLVIVDENGIKNLIGESNYMALVELSTYYIPNFASMN